MESGAALGLHRHQYTRTCTLLTRGELASTGQYPAKPYGIFKIFNVRNLYDGDCNEHSLSDGAAAHIILKHNDEPQVEKFIIKH